VAVKMEDVSLYLGISSTWNYW